MSSLVCFFSFMFAYLSDVVGGDGNFIGSLLVLLMLLAMPVVVVVGMVCYWFDTYNSIYHTLSTDITNQPNTSN